MSATLQSITKSFGDFHALNGISFEARAGEFMTLVGPSGCGKSTLLRIIAGLEDQTSGDIFIGGKLANDTTPKERNIALVFQNYALYPHMTVRKNIEFNLRLSGVPRAEIDQKVQKVSRLLEIDTLLGRYPGQLSGGQRQRVAMGRAMVRNPAVFLFDEPLSNLDAKLRVQMRAEIRKLHNEAGKTSIYVTHDQVEAMTLSDRVVVLNNGHVEQTGTPTELYARPINKFVAGFMGSPSMNFFQGGKVTENGAAALWLDERHRLPLGGAPVPDGGEIVVGLRPEALAVAGEGEFAVDAIVEWSESTGAQTHAHVRVGREPLLAVLGGNIQFDKGQAVRLTYTAADLHLFDAATGRRLN
jgi:multiple sugar transport system ATP-binding protein